MGIDKKLKNLLPKEVLECGGVFVTSHSDVIKEVKELEERYGKFKFRFDVDWKNKLLFFHSYVPE